MNIRSQIRSIIGKELPFFLSVPALLWQMLFLYLPLVLIVVYSFVTWNDTFQSYYITLSYYIALLDLTYFFIILRSATLATINAIVCVLLAYPIAYYLAFYVKRFKNHLLFFLILPFWISFLVQIYAWFFVLEKNGLINSLLISMNIIGEPIHFLNTPYAILLVMIYCYLPFAVMPIYSTLEKFDKRLIEASADLGANQWQTLLKITLPLSAVGLRTGFFLVLVPSFGEFVIPALLGGNKQLYVGTLISDYFLLARNFTLGSAFTCLAGVVLLILCALWYAFFKRSFNLWRQ